MACSFGHMYGAGHGRNSHGKQIEPRPCLPHFVHSPLSGPDSIFRYAGYGVRLWRTGASASSECFKEIKHPLQGSGMSWRSFRPSEVSVHLTVAINANIEAFLISLGAAMNAEENVWSLRVSWMMEVCSIYFLSSAAPTVPIHSPNPTRASSSAPATPLIVTVSPSRRNFRSSPALSFRGTFPPWICSSKLPCVPGSVPLIVPEPSRSPVRKLHPPTV